LLLLLLVAPSVAACQAEEGAAVADLDDVGNDAAVDRPTPTRLDPCDDGWVPRFEPDRALYDVTHRCFDTEHGTMHVVDEGPLDAAKTLVLVHGNPSWSFMYYDLIAAAKDAGLRVVAPDFLGYGLSDRPLEFSYRPSAQSALLEELVVALDLQNVVLVVHDWGGPVGLGMAGRQSARIDGLLITNTWGWPVSDTAPGRDHSLVEWANTSFAIESVIVDGMMVRFLASTAQESYAGELGPTIARQLSLPWLTAEDTTYDSFGCTPNAIMAQSILEESDFLRGVEEGLENLRGKPYSFVFGVADNVFGEFRCDAAAELCPSGYDCVCDETYLLPGMSCDSAPGAHRGWTCRAEGSEPLLLAVDRFRSTLGEEGFVNLRAIDDSNHFVAVYEPNLAAMREALAELVAAPR
jgi:pimeloyl-ACP methyl ester carboxylesterase